jgi:hypothetical protein
VNFRRLRPPHLCKVSAGDRFWKDPNATTGVQVDEFEFSLIYETTTQGTIVGAILSLSVRSSKKVQVIIYVRTASVPLT